MGSVRIGWITTAKEIWYQLQGKNLRILCVFVSSVLPCVKQLSLMQEAFQAMAQGCKEAKYWSLTPAKNIHKFNQ